MIRLTLVLLMGIFATMVIAGRDPDPALQPEVTRLNTGEGGLLGGVTDANAAEALPLSANDEAVKIAIARTLADEGLAPADDTAKQDDLSEDVAGAPAPEAEKDATETAAAEAPKAPIWYVTGSRVNLRSGPSTGNRVVGQAALGQKAEKLEESGGWIKIRLSDSGETAYIYGKFLSPEEPS